MFRTKGGLVVLLLLAALLPSGASYADTASRTDYAREYAYTYEELVELGVVDVQKHKETRVRDALTRLPKMQAKAVELLYPEDLHNAEGLVLRMDDDFLHAREDKAARDLGAAYYQKHSGSRIVLGELVRAIQPLAGDSDDFAAFLSHFLQGYRGNEVLILTNAGIKEFRAYSPGRPFPWREAPEKACETDMLDRLFSTGDVTMIPFFAWERFEVNLQGKESVPSKLWKVAPGKVDEIKWEGGNWQRVVAVRGAEKRK